MSETSPPLQSLLVDTLADEYSTDGVHLEGEQILAYYDKRLSREKAEEVRHHLLGCAECRALLLSYASMETAARPAAAIEIDSLQVIRAQAAVHQRAASTDLPTWETSQSSLRVAPAAAAAALAVACLILSLLYVERQEQLEEANRPWANSLIEDVYPTHDPLRGGEPAVLELGEGAGEAVLVLHLDDRLPGSSSEIRLLGPSGSEVWSSPNLEIGPHRTATISLPWRFLSPGTYRLRVIGTPEVRAAEFHLEVQSP